MTKKKKAKKRKRPKKKKKKLLIDEFPKKSAVEKPAIETPDVESQPWPRAGDNKEFEEILGKEPPETKTRPGEPPGPEKPSLKIEDVAEWVSWPFSLWSTSQHLPAILKPGEALEIAEPLTRILNRHGVQEKIPPDVFDGLQVAGRTLPAIQRGNDMVKRERQKRAAEQGKDAKFGSKGPKNPVPQGAPPHEPVER